MKRILFLTIFYYILLPANAQNYIINFSGSGASTTVNTVIVENLTKGGSLNLNGDDELELSSSTSITKIESETSLRMKIYPNPFTDESTLLIYPPVDGDAIISIYEMSGKLITQIQTELENGQQELLISGLNKGLYLVSIKGNTYQYSKILIGNSNTNRAASIKKSSRNIQAVDTRELKITSKGVQETIDMDYTTGDILKFTGVSGDYSTVVTAKIEADTTITFNFVACTDNDGNNYPVVNIGGQLWMAKNLAYLPAVNPPTTGSDFDAYYYVHSYEGTNVVEAKTCDNYNIYGVLYNWVAAKKACPSGWYLPSDSEWTILFDYLGGENIAGSKLKETGITHWLEPNSDATNESGFTSLPGGDRRGTGNAGSFGSIQRYGPQWTSTETSTTTACYFYTYYGNGNIIRSLNIYKGLGAHVRCLYNKHQSLIPNEDYINDALLLCYSKLDQYIEYTYLFDAIYSNYVPAPGSLWTAIDQHTQTATDSKILKLWKDAFDIIYKTNLIIRSSEIVIPDPSKRKIIIAQAKAIRAYLYYNLLIWFGGVPIEEGFTAGMIPRNTIQQVLTEIRQDATDAFVSLPLKWPSYEKFRIPMFYVKGLLARTSLYNKNWTEALTPIKDIMNASIYAISADTNNFSPTNTEVFWSFEKINNTEFSTFFNKGSYVPGMRYTETLLTYVESLFKTGDTENAKTYFNILRQRRGQPFVTALTNDDIYKQWKTEMAKEGEIFITSSKTLNDGSRV